MLDSLRHTTLLALALLSSTACMSSHTGGTVDVTTQVDRSDPVRAAVADVLAAADEDFAPLLTTPFDEAERAELIEETLQLTVMNQAMSKADLLRAAETIADSARHVTCELDGARAHYWEQDVVTSGATSAQKFMTWTYDVPFEQRRSVAADLEARIAPMFSGGKNWTPSKVDDPALNPHFAQTMFSTYTNIDLDGDSTMLIVSVEYAHDEANHAGLGGVMMRVMKMDTDVD